MLRLTVLIALILTLAPATASAQHYVYYHSYHPIPTGFGGGLCETEGVHPHEYAPVEPDYYQLVDGVFYYIGDPGDEVFEEVYWYTDHHPVPSRWGGGVCYIGGRHRHWWRPHVHVHFHVVKGSFVYRGPWAKTYRPKRKLEPTASAVGDDPHTPGAHRRRARPGVEARKARKRPRNVRSRHARPHYRKPAYRSDRIPASKPAVYRPDGETPKRKRYLKRPRRSERVKRRVIRIPRLRRPPRPPRHKRSR